MAREDDGASVAAIYQPFVETSVISFEAAAPDSSEMSRRIVDTGFKHDGWHDVGWWELTLQAHSASPQPPLAFAALRSRLEWESLVASGEQFIRPAAAR